MTLRRRFRTPLWKRKIIEDQEAKLEQAHDARMAEALGLTEQDLEDLERMKLCICPHRGCPIHPTDLPEGIAKDD